MLHSIRTAVSASRESRLRRSSLRCFLTRETGGLSIRWSNWSFATVDPNRRQCFALELTAEVASSTTKFSVVVHYLRRINCSTTCCRMTPGCWLVSSAAVIAIASITLSTSTLSDVAVAGYSPKKSLTLINQKSCSFARRCASCLPSHPRAQRQPKNFAAGATQGLTRGKTYTRSPVKRLCAGLHDCADNSVSWTSGHPFATKSFA